MGIPKPVHALDGHCSIVHDNTLYVYSPAGFQSLKLEEGAEWKTEPMDISLTGAQCVKAVPGGDSNAAKLFIVGGSVNETAATWDYPGLMHYTFADKKWDWVRAESWVTQNRQNHAATYLSDSQQLLVYAGSQTTGNVGPSSETFLISTLPPFVVQASPSAGAPPSVMPMLMDVDSSRALMVGGGATNTAVYTFSTTEGWRDLGVALQQPITNQATVQCAVVKGDDGSLVLEQFDLGVSPNKVSRILLLDQNGNVAQPGTTIGDKTKRVTVSDWPAYNETFAPTVLRNGYSIAQDNNGLTVVTGGNAEEPISVFDSQANSWVNTTELFSGEQVRLQSSQSSATSSSPASTASATPSSTPTETAAAPVTAPASNNNKDRMLTVLGATLGTIFGIAAILILLLFCLKYKKSKRKNGQQSGYIEKDRLSFADRGAEFMKEAGGSVSGGYARNNDSVTSLAIFNGKGNSGHRRNMASDASTAGLVKKPSPLGYSDPVELSKFDLKPEPVQVVRQNSGRVPPTSKIADRSRSSGWSRYFANNEATNLANIPADRSTFASDRSSGISQSNYTNTRMFNHPSQTVPPLDIPRLDGQRLSHVASGSPTLGNSRENLPHQLHQPMQAELGRANSNGSSRSGISHHDDYYLRKPVDSWTPVGDDERPPSSNYTNSMVFADNHKGDGTSSYYPDNTSSFYPKSNFSSFYPGQGKLDIRDSTNTMFPTSTSGGTPEMPKYPFGDLNPPSPQLGVPQNVGRESTATVFPPSNPAQTAAYGEEMSKSKFNSMYPAPPRLDGPVRGSGVTIFPGPNAPPAQAGEIGQGGLSSFYPSPPRVGHESSVTVFPGQAGQPQGGKQQDMSWLNLGGAK